MREKLLMSPRTVRPERAVIVTRSYRATEGEPIVLRRAKALSAVLSEIPIVIGDGEMIVGTQAGGPRWISLFPEMSIDWLEAELLQGVASDAPAAAGGETQCGTRTTTVRAAAETVAALPKTIEYWRGRTLKEAILARYPESVKVAREAGLFVATHLEDSGLGHVLLSFPRVLSDGLRRVSDDCRSRLASADPSNPDDMRKAHFWQAAVVALEAVIRFARRHADLAGRLADAETDPERRRELLAVKRVCERVPEYPPSGFHEALQSVWFAHLSVFIEQNGGGSSLGRLDQYLYPFYVADLRRGVLTRNEALELICLFYLKLFDVEKARPLHRSTMHAGLNRDHNITLGGLDADGRDSTNELTELFLEAEEITRLPEPQITLRVSGRSPERILLKAARLIAAGGGKPQLLGDNTVIQSVLHRGIPLSEARDYCPIGCVENDVIGGWNRCNAGYVNIPKALELALNRGRDPRLGRRVGPETPDPLSFRDAGDLLRAFRVQLAHAVDQIVTVNNIVDEVNAEIMPYPYISSLVPGCVESGRDVTAGGAKYNWTGVLGVGVANTANSIEAVDHLVFRTGRLSMEALLDALRSDFADPVVRKMCLDAPKYGNDVDSVDLLAHEVFDMFADELERHTDYRGGRYVPGAYSLTSNVSLGYVTGATPDGRKAGQALAEGISPSQGTDKKGPTAVMQSVAKIDLVRATNGVILNQKFSPGILRSDEDIRRFVQLCRTFLCSLGGLHVQFNVISAETLRDAQKNPEKYRDLLIRVTGYSAFFTDLDPEIQEDIIARTEQGGF
jgi:formate C-acetyltransferase